MRTYSDTVFGRILKNWAAQHQPPDDGRIKLLSKASQVHRRTYNLSALIPRPQFNDYPIHSTNEWSQSLCSWFFAQSIHASVQPRV